MSSIASETTCDKFPTPTSCYTSDYISTKTWADFIQEASSAAMGIAFNY